MPTFDEFGEQGLTLNNWKQKTNLRFLDFKSRESNLETTDPWGIILMTPSIVLTFS